MNSTLLYTNTEKRTSLDLSIVIPTYKRAKYLCDSLESIKMQQAGHSVRFEVVVVNNDPTADMEDIIEKYADLPISFYRNVENYGQVGNVNLGAMLARGRYICYLHDDDLLLPGYLRTVEKFLQRDFPCILPEYMDFEAEYHFDWKHWLLRWLSCFRVLYKGEIQKIDPNFYKNTFYNVYDAPTCGVLFLKQALEEFGFFRDERGASWDYYNLRHFNETQAVYMLHRCIGARRRDSGMSNTQKVQEEFRQDATLLREELAEWPFVKRYGDCILTHRPLWKFAVYRVVQDARIYLNNMERHRPIKRHEHRWIRKYFTL